MCSCRVLQKDRSTIPCYWESQPGGCTKPHCVFKHQRDKTYPSTAVQIQHPQRIGQLARCKMNAPFLKRRVSVHVFLRPLAKDPMNLHHLCPLLAALSQKPAFIFSNFTQTFLRILPLCMINPYLIDSF